MRFSDLYRSEDDLNRSRLAIKEDQRLYRKVGKKFTPVNDPYAYDGLRDGFWLIQVKDGCTSIRQEVYPDNACIHAAARLMEKELIEIIRKACEARPSKTPLSPEEKKDWDKFIKKHGYDYVGTPLVSLKIADTVINPLPESNTFTEQEYVYQGANLAAATFKANVKSYNRSANTIRLYNYSGTINTTIDLKSSNGVYFNVNTLMNVAAPAQYPASVITTGLPNPMYYGNGRAKAIALFANGLIEFTGFFLNADGFPSADKVLQDGVLVLVTV